MTRTMLYRNSTALALALAMTLPAPTGVAFAQDNPPPVNCEENPEHPECVTPPADQQDGERANRRQRDGENGERKGRRQQDEQPAAEQPAPEQPAPEQPAAEQPAPQEEPKAEEPAPQPEQPQAEQPNAEEPQAEQPAPEAPAPEPEQPQAEEPAADQTQAEEPKVEQPAATTQGEPANDDRMNRRQRDNAGNDDRPRRERNRDRAEGGRQLQEGETVEVPQEEEPQMVIPDNATAEQREGVQRDERRRREEAREDRGENIGAAAVGAILGAVIPALGGKVIEDQGDRIIVERNGRKYVRKDDNALLRRGDADVTIERLRGGRTLETVTRRNGVVIQTVRDEGGYILRRTRTLPGGRELVLIDNRGRDDSRNVDYGRRLPPIRVEIPQDRYIVPARQATRKEIYDTIAAPPVEQVEESYTLREVRDNERLRAKVRRVDLDTITFETGSAVVRQSQVPFLEDMAKAILALIEEDPSSVILVEGHTDAVGSDNSNLALSDRRAETVAGILVDYYDVPAESLVVQGYGEQFLKVATQGAEAQNRRATIRNITPLLAAENR